jgi:hypothetical protein
MINIGKERRCFLLSPSTDYYETWHGYGILILDHLNSVVYTSSNTKQ